MVSNSDLEKWHKTIQGIEAAQKDLSQGELSAFHALKELFNSGNFESNESAILIKIIKDALPAHGNHRLLQRAHLPNFIKLCETYFKNETKTVASPTFQSPIIQPPIIQPPVNPRITLSEPVASTPPSVVPVMQENKDNKNAKKSNKPLILLIAVIALLIVGWQIYKNWDTVSNFEPISKLLGKTTTLKIPVDSMIVAEQTSDSVTVRDSIAIIAEQIKDSAAITSTTQENEKTALDDSLKTDTQPIKQTSKVIEKTYSFGIYKGGAINGYPEGDGKMTYSRQVQIAKHDTKSPPHFAESGDYFVGSWGNGDIISGTLYNRNGNVKEKILAPKRFNLYNISND